MKRLLIFLFAASVSTPALAQHGGHATHVAPPAPPACTPEHAAMGHCRMPATTPAPAAACTAEHAAMGHCTRTQPQSPPDPHAGHATAPAQAPAPPAPTASDPHAGHAMPQPQPQRASDPTGGAHQGHDMAPAVPVADPHAGHQMGAVGAEPAAPPAGPPPPEALSGPVHAADQVFDAGEMAAAREGLRSTHGDMRVSRFGVDQLEAVIRNGREGYAWEDLHFWHGGDLDRLWIKSEGEGLFGGGIERAEVEALWSHAIAPFFDLQTGVRYDVGAGPDRGYLVLGLQGLAPYWFEIDTALFLSQRGDLSARFEGEYDQRLTQRLILQPRVEIDASLQDVPELRVGSGLSTAEAGLRLRYEFAREFAPYVGVQYERAFGDTRRFRRAAGEDVGGWSFLVGVRAWF